MKLIMKPMFLVLILLLSCNNEELFVEPVLDVREEPIPDDTDTETITPTTTPCDFNLDNVTANSTIVINCVMDLGGQTITLPAGVTIVYDGGDIINGTINFGTNNVVSGELLNSTLTIAGSKPQMKDTTFDFDPKRWGIVEGEVTDDVALNNTIILEKLFFDIKTIGVFTFKIDKLDAYFKVDGPINKGVPSVRAINIPSDFNLVMTDNSHLRMQPNGHFRANLLCILEQKNIKITGGYLHGEREQHNYNSGYVDSDGSTGPTNEWLNTMEIRSGQNIIIDGVTFMDAAGDGLLISGSTHYTAPNHMRSQNIQIINCKFIRARRTNLVLTSCTDVTIANNDFIDGGIDMPNSEGAAPSADFNTEPVRTRDSSGNLIEWERVDNIIFRNNNQQITDKVANPKAGGFLFSHGNGPMIFEENNIDSAVSFTTIDGLIIRNNNIGSITAGTADNTYRTNFVYGNEIYGNTIKNGVIMAGNGVTLRNNIIGGTNGIYLGPGTSDNTMGLSNAIIKNNTLKCSKYGIVSVNAITNTLIEGNTIEILAGGDAALSLFNTAGINNENANFILKNNVVTGSKATVTGAHATQINANSISLIDNVFGNVIINGGKNINFTGNKIEAPYAEEGLLINKDCPNSTFTNNEITYYTSKAAWVSCVKIKDGLQLTNSVIINNNICIEK
ncbi:hypothetical protein [Mariniflexile sp.]|uniref:hypothetical protein n=1 Tax=Mariniflexile sp. TaxID=1979402 RepID=UPI00356209E3